jgi:PAS domain S-box-containing protein
LCCRIAGGAADQKWFSLFPENVPMPDLLQYDQADLARALFEESADALFVFNPENDQLLDVNAVALRLTGFTRKNLIQLPATYLFRFGEADRGPLFRAACRKTGIFHSQEGYFLRTHQDRVWVPVNISISRLHVQPAPLAMITARDVRELREAHARLRERESELGRLMGSVSACLWSAVINAAGKWEYRYCSPAVERLTGRTPDYFLPGLARWESVIHPDDRVAWRRAVGQLRLGKGLQGEYRVVDPQGVVRWVHESVTVTRRGSDGGLALDAVLTDVTEQRAAERALRESEERFRRLIEQAGDAVFVQDHEGRLVDINQQACDSLGYTRDELLALTPEALEQLIPAGNSGLKASLAEGWPVTLDAVQHRKDGTTFPVEVRVSGFEAGGRPLRLALVRDVTERVRAAEKLREQQVLMSNIIAHIPISVFWKDRDSVFLGCNLNMARDVGRASPDEVIGLTDHDMPTTKAEADWYVRCDREVMTTGKSLLDVEETQQRPDGTLAILQTSKVPLRDAHGQVVGIMGIYADVTERKRRDQALRASEERYRLLFERNLAGVVLSTLDGRLLGCNESFARILGCASPQEVLAHTSNDFYSQPEHREEMLGELRARRALSNRELLFRRQDDGNPVWVLANLSLMEDEGEGTVIHGTVVDITDRKRAEEALRRTEEQYRQAQKMEAVGRLAGGVAHDFNNLLTVIHGYSEMLLAGLPAIDPRQMQAREIRRAAERAADLTRQLLAFSRKAVIAPRVLNLNALVRDMEGMLRRLLGEDIDLATAIAPDLGAVKADRGHIEQVIMNLAVNARDAMPKGGKLTIELRNVELDEDYVRSHPEAHAGPHVSLAVSDTGVGMDKATAARVFEPFFTTKGNSGTGLGLATVYGAVRQSGGHVTVYSEPGLGTTFRAYLPRVFEDEAAASQTVPSLATLPRGTETILLAEDEPGVRSLARQVLESCGYRVLEAGDGDEALRVAGGWSQPIALLVTDVVMPRLGGREASEQLRASHPETRVLFLSGYTDDAVVRHGVLEAEVQFLQKPFTPAALAHKVRHVLDDGGRLKGQANGNGRAADAHLAAPNGRKAGSAPTVESAGS